MTKRLISITMAFIIAVTTMISFSISTTLTGNISDAEAATTYSSVKLKVHYHRFDKNYTGWNLWIWPNGKDGAAYQFNKEDEFGKLADITIPNMSGVTKIGFLMRYSEPGNEWKDREFGDRFITQINKDGTAEIWLAQGIEKVHYKRSDVDLSPRVSRAAMDSTRNISFEVNIPFANSSEANHGFVLKTGTTTVPIGAVNTTFENGFAKKGVVVTRDALDLNKKYTLSRTGYKEKNIIPGKIFGSKEFESLFTYTGSDLGLTYSRTASSFRVWAPTASQAKLHIFDKHDQATGTTYAMKKAERGTWTARVNGNLAGKFYTFEVLINETWNEAVDPYARAVSVNGEKGAIIDMSLTNPPNWTTYKRPTFKRSTDAVIYELHVRDFSIQPTSGMKNKGKFLAFTERNTTGPKGTRTGMNHIKDLGVTHVQLLPFYDYATVNETKLNTPQYNWGYDPKNYNAPEGSYSTDPYKPDVRIRELKQAIQAMHREGIGVIMDVVYNHVYNLDPSNLNKLVPGYYFRYNDNGTPGNGTGVGNETASERSMMRKLMVDSTNYWAREYKLDGYRFDLMGIHDVQTMNTIRSNMTKLNPAFIIIGEGWIMGNLLDDTLKANQNNAASMPGIAHFNDSIRDGLKGSVWNDLNKGFVNGNIGETDKVKVGIAGGIYLPGLPLQFAKSPDQSVTYVEAHDNLTLWDKLLKTNASDSEATRIKIHKLASSIALTAQGVPFVHAGQEFLRTKGGDHNSYKSPDRVNQMDWARKAQYQGVVNYFKGIIQLRKAHPAFRLNDANVIRNNLKFMNTPEGVIAYSLNGKAVGDSWNKIVVVHNANRTPVRINLPDYAFWRIVVDGQRAGVEKIRSFTARSFQAEALATTILYMDRALPEPRASVSGPKLAYTEKKTTETVVSPNDPVSSEEDSGEVSEPAVVTGSEPGSTTDAEPGSETVSEPTSEPISEPIDNKADQPTNKSAESGEQKVYKTESQTTATNDSSNVVMWMSIGVTVVGILVLALFILIIRRTGKTKKD